MSLFCFLWVPLFYIFLRSVREEEELEGGVTALLLGGVTAVVRFLLGNFVEPGGFGFSRWMSGFVDIVAAPVLLPLIVYLCLVLFKVYSRAEGFTYFALIWLIPVGALRAVGWSAQGDPILLVLTPLLWTAQAVGIPFFINLMLSSRRIAAVFCAAGILILSPLAATVYWAFFCQRDFLAWLLLIPILSPAVFQIVMGFLALKK